MKTNLSLDAKGLACPMPIVKTKKAMSELNHGEVLEVVATDKGSKADIQAWSKGAGHQYLGTIEDGTTLKHYLRKNSSSEEIEEIKFPNVVTNEELQAKLEANEQVVILDVREPAEFAFGHIPSAISIPFGDLETRIKELNPNEQLYVVCRTGNRSDMAAQMLSAQGFTNVLNVMPGMSVWTGKTENTLK